jgi:NADPH2:quinone reductase
MRAAYYEAKGPARDVLRVGDLELPQPARGEVRIRVHASGVNPTDTKSRGGFRGNTSMPFPRIIPHQDGAGVIEAVGDGVPQSRVGERVWIYEAQWQRPFGTAAEFVSLPSTQAVRLPDGVEFVEGACLGIPAMTAHRCVFADGDVRGKTVLVSGGAGAVGFYAIQLAKWGGATVLTTISGDDQRALVLGAGADHAINRKSEDVAARVRELTGGGVDRIIEVAFGANLATNGAILKRRRRNVRLGCGAGAGLSVLRVHGQERDDPLRARLSHERRGACRSRARHHDGARGGRAAAFDREALLAGRRRGRARGGGERPSERQGDRGALKRFSAFVAESSCAALRCCS